MKFKTILLTGMPRSGTSWLSQIFDSNENVIFKLSPLFSYSFKDSVNEKSSREDYNVFLHKLYNSPEDEFMDQLERRKNNEYPTFLKNKCQDLLVIKDTRYHNLAKKFLQNIDDLKIIYIVRNACGAINSWLRASKEFPINADPQKEWRKGFCRKTGPEEFWGFEDWKKVTTLYINLQDTYPNSVKIVQYEDLVDNPIKLIREMFSFTEIKPSLQTFDFLKKSQEIHIDNEYAVFKSPSVKSKWEQELNKNITNAIYKELKGSELEKFLK